MGCTMKSKTHENRVEKKLQPYLSGRRLSVGVGYHHSENRDYSTRVEKIIEIIGDRSNLIHLGCCDHKELIQKRIRLHEWLQVILEENANKVIGIDINSEAVEYCRNQLGMKNMYCFDMTMEIVETRECLSSNGKKWDYIIAGEIIEHLDNPVEFLSILNENYHDMIDKLVVTVPNAFYIDNFKRAWRNQEIINSDHRYWFTPYTIAKVLTIAGFHIEQVFVTDHSNNLCRLLGKNMMGNTLVTVASFGKKKNVQSK